MKDINIEPEIRMSLFIKEEDLEAIIAAYLEEKGYMMDGKVAFDIRRRCVGFGQGEHEEIFLAGARVDVKKKE